MQKSNIAPVIYQEMLDSAANAVDRGQSQFFTPLAFGEQIAVPLCRHRGTLVDLNCGAGHLLNACANKSTACLLGSDIDPCRAYNGSRHIDRITRDLTLLYPLLKQVNFMADTFVLNPPWGLEWHSDRLALLAKSRVEAVSHAFHAAGETIDSTVATLIIALDLCTVAGEGLLIANHATLDRLIFAPGAKFAALAKHIWGHLRIEGNPMTNNTRSKWGGDEVFHTSVIYFAADHHKGCRMMEDIAALPSLRSGRAGSYPMEYHSHKESVNQWLAVKDRVAELASDIPKYHLWLAGTTIQTHLSRFEQFDTNLDKNEAHRLNELNGKTPMELVVQRNKRQELLHVAKDAGWKVEPALLAAVDAAIREYHAARAPLYPLPKIKRLGYLDEEDTIVCETSFGPFRAGRSYEISSKTVDTERTAFKPNSMTGDMEKVTYTGTDLAIFIKDDNGSDHVFMDARLRNPDTAINLQGKEFEFTLEELCEHFLIPEVPDISKIHPAKYEANLATLAEIEKLVLIPCGVALKSYQREDMARSALTNGHILGWDTGLGKGWALVLYPLLQVGYSQLTINGELTLKPHAPCLIIAPGDLHEQICREAKEFFKINVRHIDSQATFNALCRRPDCDLPNVTSDGRPVIEPDFYISSYTEIASNNVNKLPDPEKWEPRALLDHLCLKIGDDNVTYLVGDEKKPYETVTEYYALRCVLWRHQYSVLGLDARSATLPKLEARVQERITEAMKLYSEADRQNYLNAIEEAASFLRYWVPERIYGIEARFSDLNHTQHGVVIRKFCEAKLEEFSKATGEIRAYPIGPIPPGYIAGRPETDTRIKRRVKCVYSPSLSDLSYNAFDAISIDEGVRMKGEDSLIGLGVRQMDPLYRNVATATPIKNRLPDIFWLAHWAAGGHAHAHARFPYRNDSEERARFTSTFLVQAITEGRDKNGQKCISRAKVTAEVCNIHLLWKLMGPLLIRRRKSDCGENIVPRIKHIYRCKMGTEQRKVYRYHLEADYKDRNGKPALGAKLQALRQASVAPASDNLTSLGTVSISCGCKEKEKKKCQRCRGAGELEMPFRSHSNYIPKTAAVLSLIKDIIDRKEQVIVFSAFNEPNDDLSVRLKECGIRHQVLDGRSGQKKRGNGAAIFKAGRNYYTDAKGITHAPLPVTLAGVESMGEGHSFHRCNNVILYCYSWAMDKFKQALDRVHRLNSEKPINVYVVFCDGTIDQRLESLTDEKTDTSDLVLDGALMGERAEEVNFAELLRLAESEFNTTDEKDATVDEARLLSEWPKLRLQLTQAGQAWDQGIEVMTAGPRTREAKPAPIRLQTPARQNVIPFPKVTPPAPAAPVAAPVTGLSAAWRQRMQERAAKLAQYSTAFLF